MRENKAFGFDTIDLRLGGLQNRIRTAEKRIKAYLDGTIDKLEEFDEPRLFFDARDDENGDVKEKIRWNGYAKEYNTKVHTVYERDAAGQPVRVHAETYNAKTGERTKTTDTGYAIEYINDANGRLTGLNRYETGSGRLMQKITYVYDDSGKLIGFTESVGRDEPIPGMEWLKLNDDLRGDTDIIWRTPEAYHAQAEEAE
jgi:hypothetical protein